MTPTIRVATTPWLDIAYEAHGPDDGEAVVLLHGFPTIALFRRGGATAGGNGHRVIVPICAGSARPVPIGVDHALGQQAAIASDLIELIEALAIPRAVLMGFDWAGARPASSRRCGPTGARPGDRRRL